MKKLLKILLWIVLAVVVIVGLGVGALTALEDVALAGNRLAAFPEALVALPHLRNLDLRGNGSITELPPNIGDMKALRTLTLSGCRLPKEERDRIRKALPDCVINF